jgi:phosphatidylglycerol---prolipoprotein diacylglyceryl transferase
MQMSRGTKGRPKVLSDTLILQMAFEFPSWLKPYHLAIPSFELFGREWGPFPLRYYALAYILGIVLGWRYMTRLLAKPSLWGARGVPMNGADVEDFMFYAALGIILGGRIGSILFYSPPPANDPWAALRIWEGGMSFHGGLVGLILAMLLFSRMKKIPLLALGDLAAIVSPIGIFLGRIANFINGELWGRATEVPWAVIFPAAPMVNGQAVGRHPSQLYEALLEGAVIFVVMRFLIYRRDALATPGLASGVFLVLYAVFRTLVEQVRQPDANLSNLPLGLTMGTILSLPMFIGGLWLIWRTRKAAAVA